jgi:hypothetical protein
MPSTRLGNRPKFHSYKEAWERIKASRKAGFFLEAIVIEESIISDRLISYLSRPEASSRLSKSKSGQWPGFAQLIDALGKEFPSGLPIGGVHDLVTELHAWRQRRNEAAHAIVKSDPGTATIDVLEFIRRADQAAEQGAKLARAVSTWHQAQKRRSNLGVQSAANGASS